MVEAVPNGVPPKRALDETMMSRAQRNADSRQALVRDATNLGVDLANLGTATDYEVAERPKDAEDLALVRQRLADTPISDHIPHARVEAEINRDASRRGLRYGTVSRKYPPSHVRARPNPITALPRPN